VTEIDGLNIHFIHVRSKHDDALPLIITHGWPGSVIEQLTDSTAHGGDARLLREAGGDGVGDDLVSVAADGFEAQADWTNLESAETYLGYEQAEDFASPGGAELDEPRTYVAPDPLKLNQWALSGDWTVQRRASVLNEPMAESRSASTPATSISSCDRVHQVRPCRSACSSTENLPALPTALTSTNRVTEPCPNSGSIS
jgi:Thioredoxin like C-terminal domain/Epoxide hydrolase N terminus